MNQSSDSVGAQSESSGEAGADTSIQRRRALLRGLSAGAALSGAAVPMSALAGGGRKSCFHKDRPTQMCKATVSGFRSVIASGQLNDWPESPGRHCSYYKDASNWPGSSSKYCKGWNNTSYTRDARFKQVFNCGGGGYNDWKIKDIMDQQVDCPQRTWITACLNATKLGSSFCYTPSEVVALYNDSSRNAEATVFFRDYQENRY